MRKYSECGKVSLENTFNKDESKNDGINPKCRVCKNNY